jgi:sulfur-oxidizing protein SoxY
MNEPRRVHTRRDLLIATGTCVLAGATTNLVVKGPLRAQEKAPEPAVLPKEAWETAIKSVTGGAKVVEGRIAMEVPEIAENGNVVPFNVLVDSQMSLSENVRSLRMYSTGNPHPLIATFRFSPDSGKAAVSSRMRLAKSQDVIALAELNDGTFLTSRKTVKVTIGGCGG